MRWARAKGLWWTLPLLAVPPAVKAEPAAAVTAVGVLPTSPMLGPFGSIADYCAASVKTSTGTCAPGRSRFARGWQRGERGAFESATTLVMNRRLGRHAIQTCHVVMKTKQGFFVSADSTTCDGQAAGERRKTQLDSLHWLDQLGRGILAVNSQRLRRARVSEARWWGMAYSESDVWETDSQLCGMTPAGVPACTAPLATSCGQDSLRPLQLEGNELVSTVAAKASSVCSGGLLPAGRYRLPFTGLASVVPPASAEAETATPAPYPLVGPFTSLRNYCLDPTTTFDPFSGGLSAGDETGLAFNDDQEPRHEPPPYRFVTDPLSNEATCDRRPGPWSGRSLRAGTADINAPDALVAVDLLSMKGNMAGATSLLSASDARVRAFSAFSAFSAWTDAHAVRASATARDPRQGREAKRGHEPQCPHRVNVPRRPAPASSSLARRRP